LWTVIWSKQPELVRLLLDAGSRTEVRFDGETPLIYAARLGREKAILELVTAGADISARDSKGRTAADHARKKRLSQTVLVALGKQETANPVLNPTRRKRRVG
jgi:ankyrin repeat protein